MQIKIIYIWIIAALVFSSCGSNMHKITISNNTAESVSQVVEIPLSEIMNKTSIKKGDHILIKDSKGEIIPSQITYDRYLLIQVGIAANSQSELKIEKGEPQAYDPLIFGRHFPERRDDFAWENDRVGFRFYGKALKEIQASTNGLDLWYKRTPRLVLEDWYRKDIAGEASYHIDHGEGCDPYAVGTTLGAGAMAPYVDGQLVRNENYELVEVLDNGPLRITAKLTYPPLDVNGTTVEDTRIVSLDAGSQYTKIIQSYGTSVFSVAAGIVKRADNDSILYAKDNSYVIYAEPENQQNGQIYIGLISLNGFDRVVVDSYQVGDHEFKHVIGIEGYNGKPITYYTGFGWNKYGFETPSEFELYTRKFAERLHEPLNITIK